MTENTQTNHQVKPLSNKAGEILWLGITSLFCGPLFGFISSFFRKLLDPVSINPGRGLPIGFLGVLLGLSLSAITIILFVRNYKTVRRLKSSWVGFSIAFLVATFLIFMIVGELLFPH